MEKNINKEDIKKMQEKKLVDALCEYLSEAKEAAKEWQDKAKESWDIIHGREDAQHKIRPKHQPKPIHLNRVGLAQSQIKAQVKKSTINFKEFLVAEPQAGFDDTIINSDNARRIVERGIRRTNPKAKISDNIGIAAVENLLVTKLQPTVIEVRGKKEFHIEHIPLNIRTYYPDAKGEGLYEIHEMGSVDKYKLLAKSSDKPTKAKPYIKSRVEKLQTGVDLFEEQEKDKDKGTQKVTKKINRRTPIMLHEFWCTVLDEDGSIMKYTLENGKEIELKDVVVTLANKSVIIQEPMKFPTYSGESLFISMQLERSNINNYGNGLLRGGVDMNKAEDALLNAAIYAGLKEGYNVNTIKAHGLVNAKQVEDGIPYGATLLQNDNLAPGEKLIDSVSTGKVPQGLLQVLGIVQQAGTENMRMNEIALTGNSGSKQQRATEIVATQQTIQGLFDSLAMDVEDIYIEKYAEKIFCLMLQHKDLWTDEDYDYIFYSKQPIIDEFKSLSPKEAYDEYGYAFRFKGKGMKSLANTQAQAQAIINLFSVLAANPILMEGFERQGLDITKMFEDVVKGVGLDMTKYMDDTLAQFAKQRQLIREQIMQEYAAQNQQPMQQEGGQGANAPQRQEQTGQVPGNGQGMI